MSQDSPRVTPGAEVYPRYRWTMVGLLVLAQEIAILLPLGLLLPSMREDLDFGLAQSGVLGMVGQLASVVLAVPSSLLLVRFRPKWVYLLSLFLTSVFSFVAVGARTFLALAIPYLFIGVTGVMRQVPDTLLRLQWIPRQEFGRVMGITAGMGAIGQSAATMVVPFLVLALGGWRSMFMIVGVAMLALSVVWLLFARERITPAYSDGLASQQGLDALKGALKRKEIIMLAVAVVGGPFAYMTTFLFLPTYLLEERGIPLTTVGLIVSLMPVGGICGSFAAGFISDKIGLRKPTMWPQGLIIPFLYFSVLSPVPAQLLPALVFILGFLAWSPVVAIRAIPFEVPGIKPSEVAVGQSIIQTVMMLGGLIGAPVVGSLAESIGLGAALRIVCAFPLTMAIMGLLIPETGPKVAAKRAQEAVRSTPPP